jgi:hypothetical protein
MEYNDEIFREQFPIVKDFLYHLTCYRELHRTYKDLNVESEFWTYTIDAHLQQACILWCMVFGSHGCNPTHWKKLCDQDRIKLENSFRQGLFKHTELTQEKWDAYWKEINDFRGGYVAHRELNYSKPVPDFKLAQEVAYFYDEWIRMVIAPDVFEAPPLKQSVLSMQKEIRPFVMHFLSTTKLIRSRTESTGGEELA